MPHSLQRISLRGGSGAGGGIQADGSGSLLVPQGPANVYGRAEIVNLLQKNLLRGLLISAAIHLCIVGAYYGRQLLANDDDDAPIVRVRLMKYSELGPPPSITNDNEVPAVSLDVNAAKPTIGTPVPVPDMEVSPEQTIATQQEMSQVQSPIVATGNGTGGGVAIQQDIKVDDDPAMDAFIPVEKNPVPVKQIKPDYPDIAKRAGVEGTVWVKILVDKSGKAKKAVVIKSDADIFNEPAVAAALQWVFTPAVMNSGPIAAWVAIPFRFQLMK